MKKEKKRQMAEDGWLITSRGGRGYQSYKKNEVAYRVGEDSCTLYIPQRAQAWMGLEPGEDHVKILRNDDQDMVALKIDESGIKFTESKTVSVTRVRDLLGEEDSKCKLEHDETYDIWIVETTDETP